MLIIHSASTCDVCFDSFKHKDPPSAIPCGHIFCYRCLTACQPKVCPLCRKAFELDLVIKLRIDTQSEENPTRPRASSSIGVQSLRRESRQEKDFSERVSSHLDHTKYMIKEVVERIELHEAVEASLNLRVSEVEWERDSYIRQLADAQNSIHSSKLVAEVMMGKLQQTIQSYESKLDNLEERICTAQVVEQSLLDQMVQLRTRDQECTEQLQRSRAIASHLLSRLHEARILDPFKGLVLPRST